MTSIRDRILALNEGDEFVLEGRFDSRPRRWRILPNDMVREIANGSTLLSTFSLSRTRTSADRAFGSWPDDTVMHVYPASVEPQPEVETTPATEADTFSVYHESMLPMFKTLAEAATEAGYCSEYDNLAAKVGAPSRDEIKALTSQKWVVRIPMVVNLRLEVDATSEESALAEANRRYHWHAEFTKNLRDGANVDPAYEWHNPDAPPRTVTLTNTARPA